MIYTNGNKFLQINNLSFCLTIEHLHNAVLYLELIMLLKGNFLPKMHTDENILRRNYLSYIFEFQLVPFAFSPILEDPLKLPPLP